jgi:2-dehydro-3-deoxy-D-arabinonate dehydratase
MATMRLARVPDEDGQPTVGLVEGDAVRVIASDRPPMLSELLHAPDPRGLAEEAWRRGGVAVPIVQAKFLSPVEDQEVWAAGVTYRRSKEARVRESAGAAVFYDLVYASPRPELFFKAAGWRVVGHGDAVHVRRDSHWNVPEPELALVISPAMKVVGYTIGNDVSSRDIEGENPLYLPQAKCYDRACAIGPWITLAEEFPPAAQVEIALCVERHGATAFQGRTLLSEMKRPIDDLVCWLGRELTFPAGVVLMTGTGIVPPDTFSLVEGDVVHIDVTGIGRLTNYVRRRPANSARGTSCFAARPYTTSLP